MTREKRCIYYQRRKTDLENHLYKTYDKIDEAEELQLKDKLSAMSEEEQIQLLATNGMLIKRPLVVNGDTVLVGFKETEWIEKLN